MADEIAVEVIEFASKIASSWRKAAASIVETGEFILEAERTLSPAKYRDLMFHLNEEVGISASVISKLRMISSNPVLTLADNIPKLPRSYATLYRMSQAQDDDLRKALDNDVINDETQLKDVETTLFPKKKKEKDENSSRPTLKLTLSGDLSKVPTEELDELKGLLNKLKRSVLVTAKGLE